MIREILCKILEDIEPELLEYSGKNMIEDGMLESIDIMEIVTEIEDKFSIYIEPEYIIPEYFETLDTLEKFVEELLEKVKK